MPLVSVRCQNCGAPLEVPPEARFLTCAHCSCQLEVHHSTSASYTTLLEKLDRNVSATARDVEVIKLQNELERLDREWQMEREGYMITGKYGRRYMPSRTGSLALGVVMIGFGIFWMSIATSMRAPSFFPLFGLVFIGFAAYSGITGYSKASQREAAEDRHQAQRERLVQRIQDSLGGSGEH